MRDGRCSDWPCICSYSLDVDDWQPRHSLRHSFMLHYPYLVGEEHEHLRPAPALGFTVVLGCTLLVFLHGLAASGQIPEPRNIVTQILAAPSVRMRGRRIS